MAMHSISSQTSPSCAAPLHRCAAVAALLSLLLLLPLLLLPRKLGSHRRLVCLALLRPPKPLVSGGVPACRRNQATARVQLTE